MEKIKKKRIGIVIICLVLAILLIVVFLWQQGIFIPNRSAIAKYPIKGIDVSSYQGEIDWQEMQKQQVNFAFIKATEGSYYVDQQFQRNYEEAGKTKIKIGAYHFFSYDSSGEKQAENFIKTVTNDKEMLPPVVDIEFYGEKEKNLPDKEKTKQELQTLLTKLEEHYQKSPIIYTTEKAYHLYIQNDFEEYPIWIRNVFTKPYLKDNRNWTFWQYTDKGQLEGYNGEEKFIDLNVFYGSEEEWVEWIEQ